MKRRIIWDCCTDLLNPPLTISPILIIPQHLSEEEKEHLRNDHKAKEMEREREKRLREPELMNILEACIDRIKTARPLYKQRDVLYNMVNGTSKLTGAPFVCNKCGNRDNKQLILDEKSGDTICNGTDSIGCGNIINDHEVDHGTSKRNFADDTEDNRYFGPKPDPLMPDAWNMSTSMCTKSANGAQDKNFRKLAYIQDHVEKNLSNIGTDDRRTREGYKTQMKREAWSIMENLTEVLSLHQQVFQKAKEEFAYFRDCKEQVNQFNGIVAACLVLAYEELSEKFDLDKEKKLYKYSIPTSASVIEPTDHAIMINYLKPMDTWTIDEIRDWISNVMIQNELLDTEFDEDGAADYSDDNKSIVLEALLDYIKSTYDTQKKAQSEQKAKVPSLGLNRNIKLNTNIVIPGFGSTTVKGREKIMGVVKPKSTNTDNSTVLDKKTSLSHGQIFATMVYKKVVTENITNRLVSIENIGKICSSLHSQRIRRVQYDMIKKDQEQRKKNTEIAKSKKQSFVAMDPAMDLDKPMNDYSITKVDDSTLELDNLIASNASISDSTVDKLLGKRKEMRPVAIKEEVPSIKIEDANQKKIKKPKIVID